MRKDLKVLESKAPEDPQDPLVPKGRADLAAKVPQGDLEILEPLVGLGSLDPSVLLGLQATVTRTPVWATTLESNCHPTSSRTTAKLRRTIPTATTSPITRHRDPWHLMTRHWTTSS